MRNWLIVGLTGTLLCGSARAQPAAPDRLDDALTAVVEAERATAPLRADGELIVASPDETKRYPLVLLMRPSADANGSDLYLELGSGGGKVLILRDGAQAFQLTNAVQKATPMAKDATVAGSEFAREDLTPLHRSAFGDRRISDEGAGKLTVSIVPKESPYSLLVITIDTERTVPLKTLYYRETISNLVKMRRDSDHVLVGRKWLPTTVTMEDFKLRTLSTLRLKWAQDPPIAPELFDPAFLAKPSGLKLSSVAANQ
jgi:hypothetical protein